MPLKNTAERYGILAQAFHWIIVALIVVQYLLMQQAEGLKPGLQMFKLYTWHKSVGITILVLAILRLLWRWISPPPPLPATMRPWEARIARLTHFALYALIFAMPITGWIMSNAQNAPVSYFGWFNLPALVAPDRDFGHLMEETHETLFLVLVAVAILHAAAALRHHFWVKDNVLKRMLPFTGALALVLLPPLFSEAATSYVKDNERSTLTVTFVQSGAPVQARFGQFDAKIAFSPDELAGSRFDVTVQVASLDSGDEDRDEAILDQDIFDAKRYPTIRFVAERFESRGQDRFEAVGKLTVRDVTREVRVPFTFANDRLQGAVKLNRLDYGVGQGEWRDTSWVANEITVNFDLRLIEAESKKSVPQPPSPDVAR